MNTTPKMEPQTTVLELSQIIESPSNTRKRFPPEEKLRELGESMKAKGQLQPVLVRPNPARPNSGSYELVFGACRFRAAKLVGMNTIVATIRDLTDVEALEIQIIENGQRSDVHELEEAEGYEAFMKHGYDADKLAEKIGRSRSHVYQRLKLLTLAKDVRAHFLSGAIGSAVALYLARVPTAEMQARAFDETLEMSAREAADYIRRHFMLEIAEAPFDTKDATLLPSAGACATCPKRTKNNKELFGDVKGDLCTDPDCFSSKKAALRQRTIDAAKKAGREVVEKPVDKVSYDYGSYKFVQLDTICRADPKERSYGELLKGVKDGPKVATGFLRDGTQSDLLPREEALAAIAKKHASVRKAMEAPATSDDFIRENRVQEQARKLAIRELVRRVEKQKPPKDLLVCCCEQFVRIMSDVLERRGVELLEDDSAQKAVRATEDESILRGLLVEMIVEVDTASDGALFDLYGVKTKDFVKQARAEMTSTPEAEAAE
ncbi:MAG TPA: ParB/RepB/Spo0J family partition protein [Polyangiaceae bacterium]|jgi:ParB/RepB/Spo0J family partition protein